MAMRENAVVAGAPEVILPMAATIYSTLIAPTLSIANDEAHEAAMRHACERALDLHACMHDVIEGRAKAKVEAEKAAAEAEKAAAAEKAEAAKVEAEAARAAAHPAAQTQAQARV